MWSETCLLTFRLLLSGAQMRALMMRQQIPSKVWGTTHGLLLDMKNSYRSCDEHEEKVRVFGYLKHTVRHPRCVFINYNWTNQLSNTTIWWLDICCLLHWYQLHVSALMAIFRLID